MSKWDKIALFTLFPDIKSYKHFNGTSWPPHSGIREASGANNCIAANSNSNHENISLQPMIQALMPNHLHTYESAVEKIGLLSTTLKVAHTLVFRKGLVYTLHMLSLRATETTDCIFIFYPVKFFLHTWCCSLAGNLFVNHLWSSEYVGLLSTSPVQVSTTRFFSPKRRSGR